MARTSAAAPVPVSTIASTPLMMSWAKGYTQQQPVRYPTVSGGVRPFTQMVASGVQSAFAQNSSGSMPWGGGCPWQCDKTAFKEFCLTAIKIPSSKERKELYGFLAECFLDADSDKDGLVGADEFDFLIERAAALPRRFGLAPSWVEKYGNVETRKHARAQMFRQMDTDSSGTIGLEEWVQFSITHIAEKVRGLPTMSTLDFQHLAGANANDFVNYCAVAVSNRNSEEYKSLYAHLFKVFVESDVEEAGVIKWQNFDRLIEDAAKAPRDVGLAPSTSAAYATENQKVAARSNLFRALDSDNSGGVTFEEFLKWAVNHIGEKVNAHRQGPFVYAASPQMAVASPRVMYSTRSCPITGAAGACPMTAVSQPVMSQPVIAQPVMAQPVMAQSVMAQPVPSPSVQRVSIARYA